MLNYYNLIINFNYIIIITFLKQYNKLENVYKTNNKLILNISI